ncbi:MAG: T9SS type A sorting domain-containing protein [Chitinophagales bacterium]
MKRSFLITLFTVLSISSFGQKIRFTDSTNTWNVFQDGYNGNSSHYLYYTNDTTVNSLSYRKLNEYAGTSIPGSAFIGCMPCLIREDTIIKKVFIKKTHNYDSTELVLIDYNLIVGDTLKGNNTSMFKVTSIDSTSINSHWYKVWHFNLDNNYPSSGNKYTIIEGIGCLSAPWFPVDTAATFENQFILTCFSNNGMTPVVSPVVNTFFNNTTSCTIAVDQLSQKIQNTTLFPNPINETSKIIIPYTISSGTFTIINDIGQTVINTAFQNKEEVLIGDKIKVPGIYYYRVTDTKSGKVFSGKFVYQ